MLIGLGTGRCGTASFARLMGLPHESAFLPWEPDRERFEAVWPRVEEAGGDVGTYWIRYVDWVLEKAPNTRFVCLERDPEEVAESWERQQQGRDRFEIPVAWRKPDGSIATFDVMPALDFLDVPQAIRHYVKSYQESSREMEQQHPECFRVFDSGSVLNSEQHQREMMEFAGKQRTVELGIRLHSRVDDEAILRHNIVNSYSMKALRRGTSRVDIPPHLLERIGIPALENIRVKLQ